MNYSFVDYFIHPEAKHFDPDVQYARSQIIKSLQRGIKTGHSLITGYGYHPSFMNDNLVHLEQQGVISKVEKVPGFSDYYYSLVSEVI